MKKIITSVKRRCLLYFLRNIHTGVLTKGNTDREPSKLFKELCNINKGEKQIQKMSFLFDSREKGLNSFKNNKFPLKSSITETSPEPTSNVTVFDTPKPTKAYTEES